MTSHSPGIAKDTEVRQLGRFVADSRADTMSAEVRNELKKRVLDSTGVAIGHSIARQSK